MKTVSMAGLFSIESRSMNAQECRQALVRQLFDRLRFSAVVETGSFKGCTTYFLSQLAARADVQVTSLEVNRRFLVAARIMNAGRPNVTFLHGDSATLLRGIVNHVPVDEPSFFYLDAHWYDHLPLWDELRTIGARLPRAVVMVDDFKVPTDDGYGFDDYGEGRTLMLENLWLACPKLHAAFSPTAPSVEETGRRRGCVVVCFSSLTGVLLEQCDLREIWKTNVEPTC